MQFDCFPTAPSEWPRVPVHDIATVNPGYKLDKNTEYPFVEMASVAEGFGGITGFDLRKAASSGLAKFKKDDILFGKITPCAENGKVALVKDLPAEFGLGSTEFIVLSPRPGNDAQFIHTLVCSNPVHGRAVSRMEGSTGRQRIREDTFTKWLLVPVPSFNEQREIARILDAVDTTIERTEQAIKKAVRLRWSVLVSLLKYGINREETKMSPIGAIPTSWDCVRLGMYISEGPTNGLYKPESEYGADGTSIIRIDSFDDGVFHGLNSLRRVRLSHVEAERYAVSEGDILINRVNSLSHIGKAACVPALVEPTTFESNMMRLRLKKELSSLFLNLVLCSSIARRQWLVRAKPAVNQASINQTDVKQFYVPYPLPEVQDKIVEVVAAIDRQIEEFYTVLKKYNRVKTGLTQDLLTGKVRVSLPARPQQPQLELALET